MMCEQYDLIKKSVKTELYTVYQKVKHALTCARIEVCKAVFKKYWEQYFSSINIEEVNQQLGLAFFGLELQGSKSLVVVHDFEERRLIAEILCD